MKAKEIILKALVRKKRVLRLSKPNNSLSQSHLNKSDHNLIVMTDLNKLGHEDWVIITGYYAMYHAALSLLLRIGLESKDHTTTAAILEYFFGEHITKELLERFNDLKGKKDKIEAVTITDNYIDYLWKAKQARETIQYGVSITCKETNILLDHARDFVTKIKLVNSELDDRILTVLQTKINELKRT